MKLIIITTTFSKKTFLTMHCMCFLIFLREYILNNILKYLLPWLQLFTWIKKNAHYKIARPRKIFIAVSVWFVAKVWQLLTQVCNKINIISPDPGVVCRLNQNWITNTGIESCHLAHLIVPNVMYLWQNSCKLRVVSNLWLTTKILSIKKVFQLLLIIFAGFTTHLNMIYW